MPWDALQLWVTETLGEKPFRARQLFNWIHLRGAQSFSEMTDIPASLRSRLEKEAALTLLEKVDEATARYGTRRILFRLGDGLGVESVLIPDPPRLTACLSTQVGCRMGCTFCMTGKVGFLRDLTAHEITAQLYGLRRASSGRISNVVLMGMGEPLENLDQVIPALDIISHDSGICIGQRRITVSTIGLPGGIRRLSATGRQYGLAVSLHSGVQRTRNRLVPAAASIGLVRLKQSLEDWTESTGRRVTLEYCLISGVNDSIGEAEALAAFAAGLPCKINLLLYNPVRGLPWKRPGDETVHAFLEYLYPRCPAVTLRRSRGSDVEGACGQLGASLLQGAAAAPARKGERPSET